MSRDSLIYMKAEYPPKLPRQVLARMHEKLFCRVTENVLHQLNSLAHAQRSALADLRVRGHITGHARNNM
eukprot:COSAG05_NODE_406_length_10149_cov_13.684478_6_plen_70_part_00